VESRQRCAAASDDRLVENMKLRASPVRAASSGMAGPSLLCLSEVPLISPQTLYRALNRHICRIAAYYCYNSSYMTNYEAD
jgi:hypothetical protein